MIGASARMPRRTTGVALSMPAAKIPVRRLERSRGRASCASARPFMCASKPWTMVTRSRSIRSRLSSGSKPQGHDLPGAGDQRHPRPLRQAEGVEQRQVVQDRVVGRDGHQAGAFLDVVDQRVRAHHALGKAGRARGVHDEGRGGGIDGAGARRQIVGRDLGRRPGECAPSRRFRLAAASPSRITRRSIGKRGSRTSSPAAGSVTASRTRAA